MGADLSSIALVSFEIINEIYVSISGGVLGLTILVRHGIKNNNIVRTLLISTITITSLVFVFQSSEVTKITPNKVVFITGCDSGLGFSFAQHACELGFTVLAGCLRLDSKGAKELRNLFGKKIQHVEIDITRSTSIEVAVEVTQRFLNSHPNYTLWAIVNNAGVMVFGEFEWLTDKLIQNQIDVNLAGTFKVTKAFCPLLRKYKGRIITVSSHCALATLPGLAVYGATKAGLIAWSDGLRVELEKYGVDVITFIPGSFVQQSNIMANQVEYCYEMYSSFTPEQKQFYGDYFKQYNTYLGVLSGVKLISKINDPPMYRQFERALLEIPPQSVYINESIKYSIYRVLFKYTPVRIRDYLVTKFIQMPEYSPSKSFVPTGIA